MRPYTSKLFLSFCLTLIGIFSFQVSAFAAGNLELLGSRIVYDKDFPNVAAGQKGAILQFYLKNISASPIDISDYAINGTARANLPTKCNPYRCTQIPDLKWWQRWPNPVSPGAITTIRLRLIDADTTLGSPGTNYNFTLTTSLGTESYIVTPQSPSLWFPYVSLDDSLSRLVIFAANRGLNSIPLSNTGGVTVNDVVLVGTLPQTELLSGQIIPISVTLNTPLTKGQLVFIKLSSADGATQAYGSLRAFPSRFNTTGWSFFNDGASPHDLDLHSIEANVPGVNRFVDEPTGQLISPQQLADQVVSAWGNTTGTCHATSPCMIQLTGFDEVQMYADSTDINMTHGDTRNQDELTYLTWPKPVWYLPQNAWGRMENIVYQFEFWYRPEDLWRQGFDALGHGAKNIQWFSHSNLWEQGYGRRGGIDYSRTKQDFYMPGTIANPVIWDRVGRISGIAQLLKPYLINSALMSSQIDTNGLEVSVLATAVTKNALIVLGDKKTEVGFYTESYPTRTQITFTNVPVTAPIPAYLQATNAYLIDPFNGIQNLPFSKQANTISFTLPRMNNGAVILLGDNSDGDYLTQNYALFQQKWSGFADAPKTTLARPSAQVLPAKTIVPFSGGSNRLWDMDISKDGTKVVLAHGNNLYLTNQDGQLIWTKTFARRMFYATFSEDNQIIYAAVNLLNDWEHSAIIAYDLAGQELWQYPVGRTILDLKPVPVDNGVMYSDWYDNVVRLSPSGSFIWKYTTNLYPNEIVPTNTGGALTLDQTTIHLIDASGLKKMTLPREGSAIPHTAAINSLGTQIAFSGYNLNFYQNNVLQKRVDAGRAVRKILFSADSQYIAAGSSDGEFTVLDNNANILWAKIEPDSYITDIKTLPDNSGVAFAREHFVYATTTMWQYYDTVEAYDWQGNLKWRHEGKWRTQPFMSQFLVRNGQLVVGTNEEIRFVDLSAALVSNQNLPSKTIDLPAPWQSQDIGPVKITGKSRYSPIDQTYTLTASGIRLGGNTDTLHFSYLTLTGDGEIVVKVASVLRNDSYTGAGVMMRESLDANAKNVAVEFLPNQPNQHISWRSTTGGSTNATWISPGVNYVMWLKLTRLGSTFKGSISKDNLTWTDLGTATVTMNNQVYIGLTGSSNNLSTLTEIVFSDLKFTGNVILPPPTNTADLNGDGFIDFFDLLAFIPLFNQNGSLADFNLNNFIDVFDFNHHIGNFQL